jgi:hypothetical protein
MTRLRDGVAGGLSSGVDGVLFGDGIDLDNMGLSFAMSVAMGSVKLAKGTGRSVNKGPIQKNEVATYQDFVNRSVVGDNLEGHEVLQHANLKANGLATERLSTDASKNNQLLQ